MIAFEWWIVWLTASSAAYSVAGMVLDASAACLAALAMYGMMRIGVEARRGA